MRTAYRSAFNVVAPTAERPLVTHEAPHAPGVDEVPEAQETSARTFVGATMP